MTVSAAKRPAVMAKLEQEGEEMWVQVLARPVDDAWRDRGLEYIEQVKNGKKPSLGQAIRDALIDLPLYLIKNFFGGLLAHGAENFLQ